MKFVWAPSISRFRRTETEAKKEKLKYEVVEYETDKDSLIDRFNGYEERIEALQEQLRGGSPLESPPAAEPQELAPGGLGEDGSYGTIENPAPTPAPAPPPARVEPAKITPQAIHEFILDHATTSQVEGIFACLGTRFSEMGKKAAVDE